MRLLKGVVVPPFTDSTPDQAVGSLFGGGLWVWLGGTLLLLGSEQCQSRLGTLLGPEETPVWGVFLVPLLVWLFLTRAVWCVVVAVWVWGVVVC